MVQKEGEISLVFRQGGDKKQAKNTQKKTKDTWQRIQINCIFVLSTCFAHIGHDMTGQDRDEAKASLSFFLAVMTCAVGVFYVLDTFGSSLSRVC